MYFKNKKSMIIRTNFFKAKQIFCFSFLSIATLTFAQDSDKKEYKNTLSGPVKSIRITTYKALDKGEGHFGKGEVARGMDNFLTLYDKKGNITERIAYYANGSVWYTKKYSYEGRKEENIAPKKDPSREVKTVTQALQKGEEGFRGRVTYRYDKKGQKTEEASYDKKGTLLWRYVYRYDNRGNIVEKDSFDPQANLLSRESYRYDANNNMLEKVITIKNQTAYKCTWQYNDKGKVEQKEEYFTELIAPEKVNSIIEDEINVKGALWKRFQYAYDNKGNRTEVSVYDAQENRKSYSTTAAVPDKVETKAISNKEPSYDELPNPKLLTTDEYDSFGNFWKKDAYTYDAEGRIIEVKSIDIDKKPLFRYVYKYDKRGNEIERINYDKDNSIVQRTTHTYDAKGLLTERAEYDSYGELIQKSIYKYDEAGNKIEQQVRNTNGSLAFVIKFLYNGLGELIETKTFNPKGELTSKLVQQFKLDEHKNWVKLTQYADGKATYITERTIEYYR